MSYSISKFEKELYFCNIYEIVEVMLREMVLWKKEFCEGKGFYTYIIYCRTNDRSTVD